MAGDPFAPRERKGFTEYLRDRWTVFFIAYFGYAICYCVRNNFKLTSSYMSAEHGISAIEVGTILTAFTVAYGLGKLLMGILIDRTSMKLMLGVSLIVSAFICALIPLVTYVGVLILLMATLGIVQGAGSPASLAMLGSWYPNESRGRVVTLWNTSQNVGAGLLAAFAVQVIERSSGQWELVFWLPSGLAFIFGIIVLRSRTDRPWQEGYPTLSEMYGAAGVPHSDIAPRDNYWKLLLSAVTSSPVLLGLVVLNALLYFIRFGVINWMPHYLTEEKAMSVADAQHLFSILEVGAIPAVLLFALLAHLRPASMSSFGAVSMVLLAVVLYVYMTSMPGHSAVLTVVMLGGLIYAPQVIVNVLTLNLVPPRMVGAAVGAVGVSGYLVGELAANMWLPRLAEAEGWDAVYNVLTVVAIVSSLIYYWLRPFEKRSVVLG